MNLIYQSEQAELVRPLLSHLADTSTPRAEAWQGWQITPISGGRNGLVYRATSSYVDVAIKFTVHDERDRVGREYQALLALQQAGLDLAPAPILVDRTSFVKPVVVQSWLAGEVHTVPPTTDEDWRKLLQHFAQIHTVTPDKVTTSVEAAVLNAHTALAACANVQQQLARIPIDAQPAAAQTLIARFAATSFPVWQPPPLVLCRVDPNILNFIQRPTGWASVDWENSGWGDPAFEIADLITHVAYMHVPAARWDWVVDTYGKLVDNPATAARIQVYRQIQTVWWVVRLLRYLYEVPRNLDQRMVAPPADWQADLQAKYEHYLQAAEALYANI